MSLLLHSGSIQTELVGVMTGWDEAGSPLNVKSLHFGIPGARSENILWRRFIQDPKETLVRTERTHDGDSARRVLVSSKTRLD